MLNSLAGEDNPKRGKAQNDMNGSARTTNDRPSIKN